MERSIRFQTDSVIRPAIFTFKKKFLKCVQKFHVVEQAIWESPQIFCYYLQSRDALSTLMLIFYLCDILFQLANQCRLSIKENIISY